MLQSEKRVAAAANAVKESWCASATVHGDLKLEHIVLADGDASAASNSDVWLVDWECARRGPSVWDFAGLVQSAISLAALGQLRWSENVTGFLRSSLADVPVESERFAQLVAMRLWQTALEHETYRDQLSRPAGELCQLALRVVEQPQRLVHLLAT